jgi:predicted permease
MTPRPEPLRILAASLRAVSSRDAASAAIGDLFDELSELEAAKIGPSWPAIWLNVRVTRAIVWSLISAVPRTTRAASLTVRDAFRSVRRSPAHSLFIVAVLALAMAAGTITFSVVDAVVLKPLPFAEPERLVSIPAFDMTQTRIRMNSDAFWRLHDHTTSLESVSTFTIFSGGPPVTIGPITDSLPVAQTLSDSFRVLRLTPALGRFWTAEEDARGDVAVLGYRFWRDRLGGSPSVLGMTLVRGSRNARVVGVLAADTDSPGIALTSAAAWVPIALQRDDTHTFVSSIGRMKPGVTPADVLVDAQRAVGSSEWRPDVQRLAQSYTNRVSSWMLLALGASALVVLIACVNAANLMLTRSVERLRETGVRASLGASRSRVAVGAMVEGLILSSLAAAAALFFATWGIAAAKTLITTLPLGVFRAAAIALNGRVLAAAIFAALLTGLLVAIVPAWQASRTSVVALLKDAGPTSTSGRGRWRSAFLVIEIASVCVLFVVSWLFVTSLVHSISVDLGVDRGHLIGVNPSASFKRPVNEVKAQLERVPGVSDVAVSGGASPPIFGRISGVYATNAITTAGSGSAPLDVLDHRVSANFFSVLGIRLTRGSVWPADAETEPFASAPVVLDEQAAVRLFGVLDPIGREVVTTERAGVHRVVGLVPHINGRGPEEQADLAAYYPLKPDPARTFASLVVRTTGPADALVPAITEAMESFAPPKERQVRPYIYSADAAVRQIMSMRRFTAGLMSAFGLVGLLIGAAGIYAVMAAVVGQKTREIGVRVALGATSRDVQRQILGLALRHLLAGLLVGLPCAWWLSRGFTALLFQVTPADASVYLGVSIVLCAVGLAASLIPSRRAASVDPIICLRAQ